MLRDDGWAMDHPKPRASAKIPHSPAKSYNKPDIFKVAVELDADEPAFSPSEAASDGSVRVCANIPSSRLSLPQGGSAIIDCGFSMNLPPGYRSRVSSCHPSLLAELVDSKRFKLSILNLGEDTILIDREPIARLWVEPVYFLEWIERF